MPQYHLREDIPAVSYDADGKVKVFKLPVGAVVTVEIASQETGLVDGVWDGRTVSVFAQDLTTRGELVRKGAA